MNLKGYSKFKLSLNKTPTGFQVKKEAEGAFLSKRLHKQLLKQEAYRTLIKNGAMNYYFEVPKIISCDYPENHTEFTMPFYNGKNILDVLERGDITMLDNLIDKLFIYLKWEFDNCNEGSIEPVKEKLISLKNNIKEPKLRKIITDLYINIIENVMYIPVGCCHGDFTFSNMIFGNKIILIDFLDSFVESSLIDLTKLYQSIDLKWELLMDNPKNRDLTKINIGYEYLRNMCLKKIKELLKEYGLPLRIFYLFQIITYLRIIPYTNNKKIYNILELKIKGLYNEFI